MWAGLCVNEAFTSWGNPVVMAEWRQTSWDSFTPHRLVRMHFYLLFTSRWTHAYFTQLCDYMSFIGQIKCVGTRVEWSQQSQWSPNVALLRPTTAHCPILGPDHKSQYLFLFCIVHKCTSPFHATCYESFLYAQTETHTHMLWLIQCRFCVCSVYKYGLETSIMAPASNKHRAEKASHPCFPLT